MAKDILEDNDYKKIAEKITQLLKREIKRQKLIKTGKMYASVQCNYMGKGKFEIEAVDYYEHVEKKYNLESNIQEKVDDFIEDYIYKKITQEYDKI